MEKGKIPCLPDKVMTTSISVSHHTQDAGDPGPTQRGQVRIPGAQELAGCRQDVAHPSPRPLPQGGTQGPEGSEAPRLVAWASLGLSTSLFDFCVIPSTSFTTQSNFDSTCSLSKAEWVNTYSNSKVFCRNRSPPYYPCIKKKKNAGGRGLRGGLPSQGAHCCPR